MNGKEVLFVQSSKKKNKTNSDDSSGNEDDVWDDSLLIEAYNKAINLVHSEVSKSMSDSSNKEKSEVKSKKNSQWKVGDKCRCEYSVDHIYYEADVIDIIDDSEMCIVKYVGYDNEEEVPLNKLKPSKGEAARSLQIKQALIDNAAKDKPPAENNFVADNPSQSGKKKSSSKKPETSNTKESSLPDSMFPDMPFMRPPLISSLPPPPPPQMFNNDDDNSGENDAMTAMLMSWYMSGFHTGYYQGLKAANKKESDK